MSRSLHRSGLRRCESQRWNSHRSASAQTFRITGLLAEKMAGEPCEEVLTREAEDGTTFCAHAYSALRLACAGEPVSGCDVRVFTRSGGERWVTGLAVDSEEGPYLINLTRDRQAAHEALEAVARAREADLL